MRTIKNIIQTTLLIISMIPIILQAYNEEATQANIIAQYFADQLKIPVRDVSVELIHYPSLSEKLFQQHQIEVQYGRGKFNLGHQTLWLVYRADNRIKQRYPVTVNVSAVLNVPTATRKISRLETITPELVVSERQHVGREYRRILTDASQIYGKMSTQIIGEGRVIEQNMVRIRPDVLLGDNLQIILLDEGLHLELPGVAKEEGSIGEAIRVQCPTTRKEFSGILDNQNQVIVSLR